MECHNIICLGHAAIFRQSQPRCTAGEAAGQAGGDGPDGGAPWKHRNHWQLFHLVGTGSGAAEREEVGLGWDHTSEQTRATAAAPGCVAEKEAVLLLCIPKKHDSGQLCSKAGQECGSSKHETWEAKEHRKPKIILDYNHCKGAVDIWDKVFYSFIILIASLRYILKNIIFNYFISFCSLFVQLVVQHSAYFYIFYTYVTFFSRLLFSAAVTGGFFVMG